MKIPMETVMKLPIQDRRYYIRKHNAEQEGIRLEREHKNNGGNVTHTGEDINTFARIEQDNINRQKGAI